MANFNQRVPENVAGDFFVDTTCIDCDACRQLSPTVFAEAADSSFVCKQPISADERRAALHALLSCPTGSIGCLGSDDPKAAMDDFPLPIAGGVFYCGFNSPKSFGGNSYFIQRDGGNWLIDSPKYLAKLVQRFEQMGGIDTIFLTHRDDVADAEKYAHRFSARRVIHRQELNSQPGAEVVLEGEEPFECEAELVAIPTPGHTEGHCCLLYQDKYLFTGDHLWWNRDDKQLGASHSHCWYSWAQQRQSMARLAEFRFEWVLPGHGQRVQLPVDEMQRQMLLLVERMGND